MPLPFDREETATTDSDVSSNLINKMQDAIKARHNKQLHFTAVAFNLQSSGIPNRDYAGAVRQVAAGGFLGGLLDLTPWLIAGDTIKEITFRWKNGVTPAAGALEGYLSKAAWATPYADSSVAALVTQNTSTGGASADRSLTLAVNHVVLAATAYVIGFEINATGGNDQAGFASVTVTLGA